MGKVVKVFTYGFSRFWEEAEAENGPLPLFRLENGKLQWLP